MSAIRCAIGSALCLVACGGNPPPVPVIGASGDIAQLVGEWTGEYRSVETGRHGSIWFRLEAGTDTARGDVLMVPSDRAGHDHPEGEHPASEYLPITFVGISDSMIRGTLDTYLDPSCQCRVETMFEGRMRGDTIEGSFTTRRLDGGLTRTGRWLAIRTRGTRSPPLRPDSIRLQRRRAR